VGWPSREMDEVLMVEVLSLREWEPEATPSTGERGESGIVGDRVEATTVVWSESSFCLRRRSVVVGVE